MKIAHIMVGRCNPDSANGVDKVVYHLSLQQANDHHNVSVVCISTKEAIDIPNVKVINVAPHRNPVSTANALAKWMFQDRPDIVHIHSMFVPELTFVGRALSQVGIPYTITPHGAMMASAWRSGSLKKRAYWQLLERRHFVRANAIHAVSKAEKQAIIELNVSTSVEVVPNGIDSASIPASLDRRMLRRLIPQLEHRRVCLYLGRLSMYHKGLDLLLDAADSSREYLADVAIVMAGPDHRNNRNKLEETIRRKGLHDSVYLLDALYGMDKWNSFASADVVILPSRYEGHPIGLLEALACGKPVLITHTTNLGEDINKFAAGVVVEASADALAAGLQRVAAATDDELSGMGEGARRLVDELFTWERSAAQIQGMYERALQNRKEVSAYSGGKQSRGRVASW